MTGDWDKDDEPVEGIGEIGQAFLDEVHAKAASYHDPLFDDVRTRVALVTGASRGLGAAVAQRLFADGGQVIALARTVGALEDLDNSVDGGMTLVPLDICDEQGVRALGKSIFDRWGGLDVWVHCAVYAAPLSPMNCMEAKDLARSWSVNVAATAHLITCLDPLLRARSGVAIYTEDDRAGEKFFGAYGASKTAQSALFSSWAHEVDNTGIKVIGFTPQAMRTAVRARFFPGETDETNGGLADVHAEAAKLVELATAISNIKDFDDD